MSILVSCRRSHLRHIATAIDGDGTESIPQNANKRHRKCYHPVAEHSLRLVGTAIDDDHETGPEAAEGALPAAAENNTPVQLITTSLILRLDTSGRLPGFYPRPGILDVPGQLARRKAQRLFPSALMDAIVRYPASNPEEDCEVGVKMCFVEGNDFGFIIEFELDDLEGPRYTKDWFDLELRTHGQMRYIQHRNRQICRVGPNSVYGGCKRLESADIGIYLATGMRATGTWKDETKQHRLDRTDCGWLTISPELKTPIRASLLLSYHHGLSIYSQLFKK